MENTNIFIIASRKLPWLSVTPRLLCAEKWWDKWWCPFLIKQFLINVPQCLFLCCHWSYFKWEKTTWNFNLIKLSWFLHSKISSLASLLFFFPLFFFSMNQCHFCCPWVGNMRKQDKSESGFLFQGLKKGAFFWLRFSWNWTLRFSCFFCTKEKAVQWQHFLIK